MQYFSWMLLLYNGLAVIMATGSALLNSLIFFREDPFMGYFKKEVVPLFVKVVGVYLIGFNALYAFIYFFIN